MLKTQPKETIAELRLEGLERFLSQWALWDLFTQRLERYVDAFNQAIEMYKSSYQPNDPDLRVAGVNVDMVERDLQEWWSLPPLYKWKAVLVFDQRSTPAVDVGTWANILEVSAEGDVEALANKFASERGMDPKIRSLAYTEVLNDAMAAQKAMYKSDCVNLRVVYVRKRQCAWPSGRDYTCELNTLYINGTKSIWHKHT